MSFEVALEDLVKEEELTGNKILSDLLNEKGIDLKTHICSPVDFAILNAVVDNLEPLLFTKSKKKCNLEKDIIIYLKKFLISWNRMSRKEITDTLKATKEQEIGDRSLFQKLAGLG